jgi:nicotinamide riboside transporter PnuC
MGTFTLSYFIRKAIIERPKWEYIFVGTFLYFGMKFQNKYISKIILQQYSFLGYRYHYWKRHMQLTAMKGHSNMYKSRREEILRWDPHADIWYY